MGKKQYNITQRYFDYFKAFEHLLNTAIDENVDFVLICGDFIDSEQHVNSSLLRDIISRIQSFQAKSNEKLSRTIPILCNEGNHETPFFSDHTWLRLLADLELIVLLSGDYSNKTNALHFKEYSNKDHTGGKIQIKNSVIYGMSFFGTSTPELFPLLDNEIKKEQDKFNVLMMHFGISGKDKRKLGHADFSKPLIKLRESIDYLALGHFHAQYTLPTKDPWVFNPGSLEVNEITEFDSDHGAFLVEIYSSKENDFKVKSLLCQNGTSDDPLSIPNRRFLFEQSINISRANSFEEAQELVIDRIRRLGVPLKSNQTMSKDNLDLPVLYFSIEGEVSYSQLEIDFSKLREKISDTFDILGVKIKNQIASQMEGSIRLDEDLSVDQIERELFKATIEAENIFEPHKEKIVDLILKLKGDLCNGPNYNVIKSDFNTWSVLNNEIFQQIIKEIVEREKKLEKQAKPKKKKLEAKPEKKRKKEFEEAGAEAGEFDFEKAFDFDTLLSDKNIDDVLETDLESDIEKDLKTDVDKKVQKRVNKDKAVDVDKEDVDEDIDEEFDENIDDRDLDL